MFFLYLAPPLGMLAQEFVHLPGGPAFSETNPLKAAQVVPIEGWIQIIAAISIIELATFKRTYEKGADLGFDPLGKSSPEMELKEVKNGRLAMLGALVRIYLSWRGTMLCRAIHLCAAPNTYSSLSLSCLLVSLYPTGYDFPDACLRRGADCPALPHGFRLPIALKALQPP